MSGIATTPAQGMRNLQPGDVVRVNRGGIRGPADERIETIEWVSANGAAIRTEGGHAETVRATLVRLVSR